MIILLLFAFLSGLVTILAPCIWPLLPIILSSTTTGGHKKPLGITLGILLSFGIFTLTISYLVSIFQFDPNILRIFAVVVIGFLGLTMVVPYLLGKLESFVSALTSRLGAGTSAPRTGFWGGFVTGLSLGIVWSPCAGPILATIATLGATQTVNFSAVLVTISYLVGIGIPLLLFAYGGVWLFTKSRTLNKYTGRVQQVFGVIMILTAISIATNYDKVLQAKLLDAFPSYSTFLNNLENNKQVQEQLDVIRGKKTMPDIIKGRQINTQSSSGLPNLGQAPEFVGITKWLNLSADKTGQEQTVTMKSLKGKVVLVDFWTYTCINCIRTLPYVTSWYDKYHDQGFVVIGIHTPEFEFEKNTSNVLNAIKQHKIHYPVGQDNNFNTWDAFNNQYWPAKYLIDAQGFIRYTHFGEGEYETTEMNIKMLLEERGTKVDNSVIKLPEETPQGTMTSETYLGSRRREGLVSPELPKNGTQTFSIPKSIPLNSFAFGGQWNITPEAATPQNGSTLEFQFTASKVFLVITPATSSDKIEVYLDGKTVDSSNAGSDVTTGIVTADLPRLYNLVDLHGKKGEHRLKLKFNTSGTSLFAFTFG